MIPLPVELACPTGAPERGVTVEVVSTGTVRSDWRWVETGDREGPVDLPLLVGLIHHPQGVVTVDAGLGETTRVGAFPGWPFTRLDPVVPAGAAVAERLPSPPLRVLITHLHGDHTGGLLDWQGAEVWVSEAEWAHYGNGGLGFPRRWMESVARWQPVDFGPGAATQVLGVPAVDVLGDGAIWYLSTPGHTPGSAAVLVRAVDGPWLFVGDTAWVESHLVDTRRPWLVAAVDDADHEALDQSLAWARWLKASCPDLRIIPGHDPGWAGASAVEPAQSPAPPP